MSLKQKEFQVFDIETKDYNDVHFIPAVVDDKEVYEVKNSSNIHCGYVTEAFLEALTKVNDDQGRVNRNFVVRQTQEWEGDITLSKGGDITLLTRKIILDAPKEPSKILVQGIVLRPTIYPEEIENKALTIATSCFRIMSPFCPLDIKVNHDFIEAESFSIVRVGGTADKSVTIDLDLATNKVGDLNIDGFYGESAFGGPYLKLKCTNEEVAPDITILGYTIDGNTNDKSEAGYIHFETAGEFAAREGRAYSVIEGNYTIETIYRNRNKAVPINIENSSLTRGFLYIEKDFSVDDKPILIINSDIDYNVAAINLDLIEASVIKGGVRFNGVREIKDAMIDQVNFEDSKINKIEGGSYLANGKIIEGSEHTKTGKVTEDLELL